MFLFLLIILSAAKYKVYNVSLDNPTINTNELYQRDKCTTCCRILIASSWNYDHNKLFTNEDYKNNNGRIFVMDMEFDYIDEIREPTVFYEQAIHLRPFIKNRDFQFFEFAPYKMFISFVYPKRVHDIRAGANVGSRLIIWSKNPPLSDAPGTQNQRFIYVHPYDTEYYVSDFERKWRKYKNHFFLPFYNQTDLCYEGCVNDFTDEGWAGQKQFKNKPDLHQIKTVNCDQYSVKQMFTPIFA
ncbi:galactose-inhibitable lectin 35 kDa subunit precursor, putative [Entamoeba invadens IP1]|uniref:Galactose-inhibitable lectin 35 kDa subunit, putative n=1 Tax=Entamoeba invadens IP1 TaxID=370355 RepID=A0A0A1UG62_ENTIV|nr:galactose-inhibitable lectin 35 kDa subunit precursor, putative [Entamoeba invadens IP1]ELP92374.1 galactose-inhibitable lectin 35 kDa subunit precursor, putative [Entamoeba invadens IP1]|eukprot:XP_004259145.1 galactose-inhibitable lectin 35 kDa subunit precursor, putative [Entamoeba invadens IP1]